MEQVNCDCGAATEGKWAGVHMPSCAAVDLLPTHDRRLCHNLAEEVLSSQLIGLDHQQRLVRLGVLLQKTIEDWLKANPPKL